MLPSGTYKALKPVRLLVWPKEWANEFRNNYNAIVANLQVPHPIRMPTYLSVKEGQEFVIEISETRQKLFEVVRITKNREHPEDTRDVNSVDVTVKVGAKTLSGIHIMYDECLPCVVDDSSSVRPVKKRTKL